MDRLLAMVQEFQRDLEPNYTKFYVGLARRGVADNFVRFTPRKRHVAVDFKSARDDGLIERLQEAGLESLAYLNRWGIYKLNVTANDLENRAAELRELVEKAHLESR